MIAGCSFSGMVEPPGGSEPLEKNAVRLERDIESSGFCVARPACIPIFSRGPIASWILTGTEQEPRSHLLKRHTDLIIDSDPQAFSRRLPWHPQDPTKFAVAAPQLGMEQPPGSSESSENGPCSRTGILKYRVAHKITLSVILLALARVRKVGGSLVVTIPREVAEEEGVKAGEIVNLEIRKTRKSFFGAARGIGPFTVEDEMKDHD